MHRVLKVLISSSIFFNFAAGMFGPIFAIFVQRIGGDVLIASSSWAIYTAAVGILILVFGRFEDKLNKRKVFVTGRALNVVAISGYFFVQSPLHLFVVQGILGIAIAMMNPTFEALYSRGIRRGHEAFEWSVWEGSINLVIAGAAVLGGIIVTLFGFKTLFAIMTVVSFLSFIASTFLLKKNLWKQLHRIRLVHARKIPEDKVSYG